MNATEFIVFCSKRIKRDSPPAFISRMARFAVIGSYMPSWILDARSYPKNGIYDVVGGKMGLSKIDSGVSVDLMVNKLREPFMTLAMQSILMPDDVVVDIGANVGYYALQEARLVCPKGHVYAIEPVGDSIETLKNNIELNGYKNISVYQMACGAENGKTEIHICKKRNWSSIKQVNQRDYISSEEIEIITLDDFLKGKRQPDMIRMDVEGFEYDIIRGAENLLKSNRPLKIFVEMHFDIMVEKSVELCEILKKYGFEVLLATIETHPAIMDAKLGKGIVRQIEKGIGERSGFVNIKIDDLIKDKKYGRGQIEVMEVLFNRE